MLYFVGFSLVFCLWEKPYKIGVRDITDINTDYTVASTKAFTAILSDKEQSRLMSL
jgi:hypothetical protein